MNRNNPDCQWFENANESFFAETLTPAERARFQTHVSDCASCAAELEQLRAIDPLMKDLLQYRIVLAQSQPRMRWGRIAALAGVPAIAGILALSIALWPQPALAPPQIVVSPLQPIQAPAIDKVESPGPPDLVRLAPKENLPPVQQQSTVPKGIDSLPPEDFAVIDAAGQISKLADFRGKYFLFGVLSPAQPRTAANLELLYRTFPELFLIGVSENRQDPAPPKTTFQTRTNKGSRLLGAQASDFFLLDPTGKVILRDKLSTSDTDALTKSVRAALGPQKKP